jgi:cytochrome c-type biogenesis protein CcmH/NrfG
MKRRWILIAFLVWTVSGHTSDSDLGRTLYDEKDYGAAEQVFSELIRAQPNHEEALYYLGRIHFDHSDLDSAKELLEQLNELVPDNADYHLQLAHVYSLKAKTSGFFLNKKKWAGRWKKQLERAYELDSGNVEIRRWLALYLLNAPGIGGGDKDRGMDIARGLIQTDEITGHLLTGYAYRRQKDYSFAAREYNTVLGIDPENSKAHRGLAHLYMAQEQLDSAEAYFLEAIELDPYEVDAYLDMASFYAKQDNTVKTIAYQEQALELDPLESDSRYFLAENLVETGNPKEAAHHYETLVMLTPRHHKAKDARKKLEKLTTAKTR